MITIDVNFITQFHFILTNVIMFISYNLHKPYSFVFSEVVFNEIS